MAIIMVWHRETCGTILTVPYAGPFFANRMGWHGDPIEP
jgi:hypothetical protein